MNRTPAWILKEHIRSSETFANLIHENKRAGIMVTHDLRMVQYVDRVLQMQDGKLGHMIESPKEIQNLAQGT